MFRRNWIIRDGDECIFLRVFGLVFINGFDDRCFIRMIVFVVTIVIIDGWGIEIVWKPKCLFLRGIVTQRVINDPHNSQK